MPRQFHLRTLVIFAAVVAVAAWVLVPVSQWSPQEWAMWLRALVPAAIIAGVWALVLVATIVAEGRLGGRS
jgi:hypothetical protein